MYDMRSVAPTVCKVLGIRSPSNADSSHIRIVVDTIGSTDKLVVVVIDALGMSTWRKSKEHAPTLNKLEKIHGTVIHSVMKTITPVNFATMLTGASPETHGLTNRDMLLNLETIFHVMRENGLRSATAARLTSSLGILISPHADEPGIAMSNKDYEVTQIAISRIHDGVNLIWVQLLDVDDAGHSFGPYSSESKEAVARADGNLLTILETAKGNGYSVFVLADHGQHVQDNPDHMGTHGTDMPEDVEVPFLWANSFEISNAFE